MKKNIIIINTMIIIFVFGIIFSNAQSEFKSFRDDRFDLELEISSEFVRVKDDDKSKMMFVSDNTIIEIYHEDFKQSKINFEEYVGYNNKFILSKYPDVKIQNSKILGFDAFYYSYQRAKLSSLEKDYNNYLITDLKMNDEKGISIIVKSLESVDDLNKFINKIGLQKHQGDSSIFGVNNIQDYNVDKKIDKTPDMNDMTNIKTDDLNSKFNDETQEFYNKRFINKAKPFWGIFEPLAPRDMRVLKELEEQLDYKFDVIVKYQGFSEGFPTKELKNAFDEGKIVELTLQTREYAQFGEDAILDILDGKYDEYFKKFGKEASKFNHPVLFRLNNEMNGDWCNYSTYYYFRDSKLFKDAWKHIYEILKEEGANNLIWVWNPNEKSFPDFSWNNYLSYYPGDEYVDIVGLTGYNTGNYYPGEVWRDFDQIYFDLYQKYLNEFQKPFIITEFASNSVGGNKSIWIEDMFKNIDKYEKIKGFIWWNGTDWDSNGMAARKYRLDEDPMFMNTFKKCINNIDFK